MAGRGSYLKEVMIMSTENPNVAALGGQSEVGQNFLTNPDARANLIDRDHDSPPREQKFRAEAVDLLVESFCREKPICLKSLIETIEMSLLLKILHQVHGNQKRAAKLLGIKYTTLNEKVKRYGIRFKKSPVPYAF